VSKRALVLVLVPIALLLGGYAPAPLRKPKPPKSDAEALQGTWTVLVRQRGGAPLAQPVVLDMKVVIQGDSLRFVQGERIATEWTFKIDPNQKPKTMDMTRTTTKKGSAMLAIYDLQGDDLKLCYRSSRAPKGVGRVGPVTRPGDFSGEEARTFLYVMKRAKP
jgi:uncharacterized protein (TIGR03067 family)